MRAGAFFEAGRFSALATRSSCRLWVEGLLASASPTSTAADFLKNLGEEPKKNEGHRADAQPNTTHRLDRVECVCQEHGKSPD